MAHTDDNLPIPDKQIGFGASGAWAMPWFQEQKAGEVIRTALDNGISHFDCAGFYAGGNAEARLGRLIAQHHDSATRRLFFSTKVGKMADAKGRLVRDFSRQAIEDTLALSCRRLGVETLDIVYMHGPNKHEIASALPQLMYLKDQHYIKAIGICSDGEHLATAAKHPEIDVVMGRYNLFDQRHAEVFRRAKGDGKQVVAIAPLAQALWRRDFLFPTRLSDFWYSARALLRNRPALRQAQSATWLRTVPDWSPAALAIAYVRLNPDIDVIMTTSTKSAHVADFTKQAAREIPEEIAARLKALPSK